MIVPFEARFPQFLAHTRDSIERFQHMLPVAQDTLKPLFVASTTLNCCRATCYREVEALH